MNLATVPQVQVLQQDKLVSMYEEMLLMRRFEERVIQLYQEKYIAGFCHTYIGQEAIVIAMKYVMERGDPVMCAYRSHAHVLALGGNPNTLMAELVGRKSGLCKGKGGSIHLYYKEGGLYGGHGIVGAYVSIGTGIAFAEQYNKTGKICWNFFGDGAANQGQVYESYNMAALWKLPVLYVIENNGYGIGTSCARSSAGGPLYKRAEPFGVKGWHADGMNVFDVIEKMSEAADYVRSGKGPAVVECATYRFKGHSVSDPGNYRTKEEVEEMKTRDPLLNLESKIRESGEFIDKKDMEKRVISTVREAVEFAKADPEPDLSEIMSDIYA